MSDDSSIADMTRQRLEVLYRECGPGLLGYLSRRLGDATTAEDLLQETFVVALRRPERLAAACSPRAYLFGIARNLAATAWRAAREPVALPDYLAADPGPASDPRLEIVREQIANLNPASREALELRLQHELSYNEIAEVLGVPVGTVRSRLHHAVDELRRAVHRAGGGSVVEKGTL